MTDTRTRCDRTPAWGLLQDQYDRTGRSFDLRGAFAFPGFVPA